MNSLGRSNFDAMFDGNVRDDVVRDVLDAFADQDRSEQVDAGRLRVATGYFNQNVRNPWGAMGVPSMRLTHDDYWRQQIMHDAVGDPGLWDWFLKRPEGEYARVKSESPKLTVGWRNCRETVKF